MRHYRFKAGNMKKEQEFTLYPYSGGDYIILQSDKRFARVNLRTGEGTMNAKGCNYANSISLQLNPLKFQLPADTKTAIQEFLWNNEGKDGNIKGVIFYENKELFSKSSTA
jgi:hypothetical protein